MEMQRLPTSHPFRRDRAEHGRLSLAACSVCLRVLAGSEWVEADVVIRRMRTYELDAVPRLRSALCDRCSESIRVRRQQRVEESFAA